MVFLIIISAFLLGFAASILSLGPANFLILKNALIRRYKESVSMIIGSHLMEAFYCGFALIITNVILLHTSEIKIVSIGLSTAIFLIMGVYFLVSNQDQKKIRFDMERKEIIISFFIGFALVAMNPGIILAWSIASGTLISLGLIKITKSLHVIAFIASVFLGTTAGSSMRIFLIKRLNIKFSENLIKYTLRIMGLFFLLVSIYFAYRLILFV